MKLSQAFWLTFLTREGLLVVSLVNSVIVARELGPGQYGVYALVTAAAGLLSQLVSMGLNWSNRVIAAKTPERSGELFALSAAFLVPYAPLALAVGLFAPGVVSLASGPIPVHLTVYVLIGAGLGAYNNNIQAVMFGLERYKRYNAVQSLPALGMGLTNIVFFLLGRVQLAWVLNSWIVWTLLGAVVTAFWLAAVVRPVFRLDFRFIGESLSMGFRALISSIFGFAANRGNHFLLNRNIATYAVGQFHASLNLAAVVGHAASAMSSIVTNKTSAQSLSPKEVVRIMRLHLLVGGAGALVIGLAAPWLVRLLFGPQYADCAPLVRILLAGTFLYGFWGIASAYISGRHGFPWSLLGLVGLLGGMTFGLGLWWIPQFRLEGACMAYGTACLVVTVFALMMFFRQSEGQVSWRHLWPRGEDIRFLLSLLRRRKSADQP